MEVFMCRQCSDKEIVKVAGSGNRTSEDLKKIENAQDNNKRIYKST